MLPFVHLLYSNHGSVLTLLLISVCVVASVDDGGVNPLSNRLFG